MNIQSPGSIHSCEFQEDGLQFTTDQNTLLHIRVLTPEILQVRFSTREYFQNDFSYALDPNQEFSKCEFESSEHDDHFKIVTSALICHINKLDSTIEILDLEERLINRDDRGFYWNHVSNTGNDEVFMSKERMSNEAFFGLGDKPVELNLAGKQFENWGMDCYGFEYGWDPLYKNIPFYYGLHNGIGYGIFFDNSFRTKFDFGHQKKEEVLFSANGGLMNYYFIAGPSLIDVSGRYIVLTGKMPLPPMWALGFHQCRWSYYPESEVKEIASKMRRLQIPCDAIYLDIDYMDGFRCFTWNKEHFPDPAKMVEELRNEGFKTVVIIDPGIKIDPGYSVYQEGIKADHFCKRLDGPYLAGKVWPGYCHFPDYTKPQTREWWSGLFRELVEEIGVEGLWTDMNEPALFEVQSRTMPDDVLFDFEGNLTSHRQAHNIYALQMVRATAKGFSRFSEQRRGLVITRSGYSGVQRYSSVWTGDNRASWSHLWLANVQCQRLAISGLSFTGSDIGGFIGQPSPELFVRWMQLAIFHPFFRVHSSQDDGDQEPWSFGEEALTYVRQAIELRYRFLPYHYTAFYQHSISGMPIIKPLSFFDQEDINALQRNNEFIYGDHILTGGILAEDLEQMEFYLPKGTWYNFWSNERVQGPVLFNVPLTMDHFPLFIKAGAIIPQYPLQQYVDELEFDEIDLLIFFAMANEESYLFEDEHDGFGFKEGRYRYAGFRYEYREDSVMIHQSTEGEFSMPYSKFRLQFIGFPSTTVHVQCDGHVIHDDSVPVNFSDLTITWFH